VQARRILYVKSASSTTTSTKHHLFRDSLTRHGILGSAIIEGSNSDLQVSAQAGIMHIPTLLLALLPAFALSTPLSIVIPASHHLQNPSSLPPSTSATLTTLSHTYTAPLDTQNTFRFRNVSSGSYLLVVNSATHAFAPLRIDVTDEKVAAWTTFRGHEWDNKGEFLAVGSGNTVEARAVGTKEYYMSRSGCELS
jgi:hypothetical protein